MCSGDDSTGKSPAAGGVGEAETASTGAPSVSGEHVAARRAGQHAAAAEAQRGTVCHARRTEETSRVYGRDEEIRTRDHTGSAASYVSVPSKICMVLALEAPCGLWLSNVPKSYVDFDSIEIVCLFTELPSLLTFLLTYLLFCAFTL